MPLNYICPITNVPHASHQSRNCCGMPQNPSSRLLQNIVSAKNYSEEKNLSPSTYSPSTLLTLAASACVNHITAVKALSNDSDVVQVEQFVSEFSAATRHALYGAFYLRWQSLSWVEKPWLASALAIERVWSGESCKDVVRAHSLAMDHPLFNRLNLIAVNALAGLQVHAGGHCRVVAENHGIALDSFAFNELQKKAVLGVAGQRVESGESCLQVARDHGISEHYEAMDMLEMVAVNTSAGERVSNGLCCRYVAREHGINPSFAAMNALANIAVRTVAGERVRRGESCRNVAREHGVDCSIRALNELEAIAVNTSGTKRIYNGEPSWSVINSLGITSRGYSAKWLGSLEQEIVSERKRPCLGW